MRRNELTKYLGFLSLEEKVAFAEEVNSTPYYLKMVAFGHKKPSLTLSNKIIMATCGAVMMNELRPDIVAAIVSNNFLIDEILEERKALKGEQDGNLE